MFIDVAITGNGNVVIKEVEKILKCENLTIEIQGVWNVKTKVITGNNKGTETLSRSFRKCLNHVTGKHEIQEIKQTAIFGTAHILRRVLMSNRKFYHGK